MNDLAEGQLVSAIKNKNLTAIIFWLKKHHRLYADKVELSGKVEVDNKFLTKEQTELINKAFLLAGLALKEKYE